MMKKLIASVELFTKILNRSNNDNTGILNPQLQLSLINIGLKPPPESNEKETEEIDPSKPIEANNKLNIVPKQTLFDEKVKGQFGIPDKN